MSTARSAGEGSSASLALLIERCNDGDVCAKEALIQRLYRDLRRMASAQLRSERRNHTLQPTALVHEAYARLVQQSEVHLRDRIHLMAIASQLMRQVLVDYARTRLASKRGGAQRQVTLDEGVLTEQSRSLDVLAVDEALRHLSDLDPRHARIVEMHFFGGLTFDEIAQILDLSVRTVKRDWTMARAWLRSELSSST